MHRTTLLVEAQLEFVALLPLFALAKSNTTHMRAHATPIPTRYLFLFRHQHLGFDDVLVHPLQYRLLSAAAALPPLGRGGHMFL